MYSSLLIVTLACVADVPHTAKQLESFAAAIVKAKECN